MTVEAPAPLTNAHQIDGFDSGVASLDDWLIKRARANHAAGATRVFVACEGQRVVGYYAIATGAVAHAAAPGRVKRNMPDPVPVIVLARLAVSLSEQGKGLGRGLFIDAVRRVVGVADDVGVRALLVHAISPEAKTFYLKLGLSESPLDAMTLMATISDLRDALP